MTFTLTGTVRLPDGTTAHSGTARVTTLAPIRDLAGNVVMTGSVQQALSAGAFSFVLPDDSLADAYRLDVVTLSGAALDPITFAPGAANTTLDLSDMVSVPMGSVPDGFMAATTADIAALSAALTLGLIYTVDPIVAGTFSNINTANRAHIMRVVGDGTISKVGLEVGTASGNIDVGVYRANGAGRATGTLTRVASSGSVACPAAGYAEISLGASVALHTGDWLAIAADNTTATFRCVGTGNADSPALLGRMSYANGAFPLPATVGTQAGAYVKGHLLLGIA